LVDELLTYFRGFGEVISFKIAIDQVGRSKGYGFLLLNNGSKVGKTLKTQTHNIHGKLFRVKDIESKKNRGVAKQEELKRKIFVAGIGTETTESDLGNHFSTFGTILDILINKDKNSGRRKGFAFILFSQIREAEAALSQTEQIMGNHTLICRRSEEKRIDRQKKYNYNSGRQQLALYSNQTGNISQAINHAQYEDPRSDVQDVIDSTDNQFQQSSQVLQQENLNIPPASTHSLGPPYTILMQERFLHPVPPIMMSSELPRPPSLKSEKAKTTKLIKSSEKVAERHTSKNLKIRHKIHTNQRFGRFKMDQEILF